MELLVCGAVVGVVTAWVCTVWVRRTDGPRAAVAYTMATESVTRPGRVDWRGTPPPLVTAADAMYDVNERNWPDTVQVFPRAATVRAAHGTVAGYAFAEAALARLVFAVDPRQRFVDAFTTMIWAEWDAALAAELANGGDYNGREHGAEVWAAIDKAGPIKDPDHPLLRILQSRSADSRTRC